MLYQIDYSDLKNTLGFEGFYEDVFSEQGFDTEENFNSYCKMILAVWNKNFAEGIGRIEKFNEILGKIDYEHDKSIKTNWGGVYIVNHEHPVVEKYLAIKKGGYLAFEKHELKEEELNVVEGAGFLLYRNSENPKLIAKVLLPGTQVKFSPGQEHCIIGTENLLIYEKSKDFKGMDKDLIFIYEPILN